MPRCQLESFLVTFPSEWMLTPAPTPATPPWLPWGGTCKSLSKFAPYSSMTRVEGQRPQLVISVVTEKDLF